MNLKEIEPILKILFFLIVFFGTALGLISHFQPNDGQTFQIMAGAFTGSLAVFLAWMKPPGDWSPTPRPPAPGTEKQTETKIVETQVGPPAEKPKP